jgi:hypothetical protein
MENEEQTANESGEPSGQPQPKSSSMRLVVMGVVLTVMVVMALIQSGAWSDRDAAEEKAGELSESDAYNMPVDYMKAVGMKPRVVATEDLLTQVYRWEGVLQHFELRILFNVADGEYSFNDIRSSSVSRFKADDISKLAFAEASGTNNKEFPKAPELSGGEDSGAMPSGSSGLPPVPSKGNVDPATMEGPPSGGSGSRGGGGGGMSTERMKERMVASFEKLELDEAQQAKVDAIIEKQLTETMALLGGPREGMREKFGALREKYTAQFKEALTEEQFEAYEKSREDARKNRGGGRGGGGGGAPPRPDGPPELGK